MSLTQSQKYTNTHTVLRKGNVCFQMLYYTELCHVYRIQCMLRQIFNVSTSLQQTGSYPCWNTTWLITNVEIGYTHIVVVINSYSLLVHAHTHTHTHTDSSVCLLWSQYYERPDIKGYSGLNELSNKQAYSILPILLAKSSYSATCRIAFG